MYSFADGKFHSSFLKMFHLRSEGATFNAIVKEIRSELAARYLSDPDLSISEVGFLLGYSEPSAFQRAFRSWYSCTPSEFRIRH